jgi:hypothetical protein
MFEWGVSLLSFKGSYLLQPSGLIKVQFDKPKAAWLDTVLNRDAKSLLLVPAEKGQGFVMGTRGGATLPGGQASYWPFRRLTGKNEQEVLKMIEERGN